MQKDLLKDIVVPILDFCTLFEQPPPNFFLVDYDEGLTKNFHINSLHAYGLEPGKMFSIRTSSRSFSFEVPCLGTFRASSWGP
jgi:hypothetical protein